MRKERVQSSNLNLTELSVLMAIIFIMGLTPIGYIPVGPGLEITLITVPVIIGAITIGPKAGLTLGTVFGLTSFFTGVIGTSVDGATLFGINPVFFFLLTVPTRMLMGWLTGMFFKLVNKSNVVTYSITGLIGSLLNTILFMSTLILLFWDTYCSQQAASIKVIFTFIIAAVGINGVVEAVACTILSAAICKALNTWFRS